MPAKTGPVIRNVGLRRVRVAELEDAPFNHRTHPEAQAAALDGTIKELGFYGYPDVYETAEGTLRLIDGHLRKERLLAKYGADTEIEVNVTDFDEAQAKKANLTKDPLAAMAEENAAKLDALMRECETGSEALKAMLDELAAQPYEMTFGEPPESVQKNADDLNEIKRQRREDDASTANKQDTEHYLVVVYSTRQAKEAALKRLGLPTDERYISAAAVSIKVRGPITPSGKTSADASKAGACG